MAATTAIRIKIAIATDITLFFILGNRVSSNEFKDKKPAVHATLCYTKHSENEQNSAD